MSLLLLGLTPLCFAQTASTPTIKTSLTSNGPRNVELTLGKASIIHLNTPATRVSISDPAIVGIVLISPTEIELIGKAIGVANLLVWNSNQMQNYLTIDLSVHRDVSTLANKIQMIDPGINILPVGAEDSVILTGVAESSEKAQLAFDLARAFFSGDEKPESASSFSGGSENPGVTSTKIINLIRVMGQPATKAELIQQRLKDIDPNIILTVVPGYGGKEKAILTGHVKNASMVSKAINLTSVFYGTPGIKIINGPGGNLAKQGADPGGSSSTSGGGDGGGLIGTLSGNVLYGSVITDSSGNVVSMLDVDQRPQVVCRIKFLEMTKTDASILDPTVLFSSSKVAGIGPYGDFANFLSSLSTGSGGTSFTPSQFVHYFANTGTDNAQIGYLFNKNFGVILNGLITNNRAKVLAEPKITSMSGEPASFLAGGQFPIPVLSANGAASVQYQEYGIRLTVLPTVTDRGTIHMQISPEVSDLDFTNAVTSSGITIPSLTERRSQTVLEMKDGDNFVLSGLYSLNDSNDYSKVPFLGDIPILGALFRLHNLQKIADELVVVIQPQILWGDSAPTPQPSDVSPSKISSTPSAEFTKAVSELIAAKTPAPATPPNPPVVAQALVAQTAAVSAANLDQAGQELQTLLNTLQAPPIMVAPPVPPKAASVEPETNLDDLVQPVDQKPKLLRQPVITLDKLSETTAPVIAPKQVAIATVPKALVKKHVNAKAHAQHEVANQLKVWQRQLGQFLTMGN